jgi:hypothetical protein
MPANTLPKFKKNKIVLTSVNTDTQKNNTHSIDPQTLPPIIQASSKSLVLNIEQQIDIQEKLEAYMFRLDALTSVIRLIDLEHLNQTIFQNYIAVMQDFIDFIKEKNQESLSHLLTYNRL